MPFSSFLNVLKPGGPKLDKELKKKDNNSSINGISLITLEMFFYPPTMETDTESNETYTGGATSNKIKKYI